MSTRLLRFAQGARIRTAWPVVVLPPPVRFATAPMATRRFASDAAAAATGPADKKPSPHGNFYRVYGRAFVKVILLSLLVYQGIYYGWLQLEHLEQKRGKDAEVQQLEDKIRELMRRAEKLELAKAKK